MRLLRVQVPEFRALKDVDISFEPEFNPQVFPLGSLNGGGKSTLLQLIFMLLNINVDFDKPSNLPPSCFREQLYLLIEKTAEVNKLKTLATITLLNDNDVKITFNYAYGNSANITDYIKGLNGGYFCYSKSHLINYDSSFFGFVCIEGDDGEPSDFRETFDNRHNLIHSTRNRVFLISPANQSYLFFTTEERRLLFTADSEKTYDKIISNSKNTYPNFFTYDFTDVLTEIFRLARDKDYNDRLKTGTYGSNSEQLENAINRLFIDGKKILPLTIDQKRHTKDAIQSMGFQLSSGEEIYPEDLSHGELKRLTIFILLKYHDIQDSIVLMDEIENGFHLDWQYNIVRDLVDWGQNNQYILATHSYELCTAVTPAHVKQIEPKLIAK